MLDGGPALRKWQFLEILNRSSISAEVQLLGLRFNYSRRHFGLFQSMSSIYEQSKLCNTEE
jgi:hypothetical protein